MSEDAWQPHTKGGPTTDSYEICVIRKSDKHGKASYGWYGKTKMHISSSGGPCHERVSKSVWDKLVRVAHEVADELNAEEANNGS